MNFVVNFHDRRQSGISITLEKGGKVSYSAWEFEGAAKGYPDGQPDYHNRNPYRSFISTLDSVAEHHPEVYRAVYEHIQCRKESAYVRLSDYCKRKNNEYARKFRIIE